MNDSPAKPHRRRRRLIVLLAVFTGLVVTGFLNRDYLTRWPNGRAREYMDSGEFDKSQSWLKFSSRIWAGNPETELLLARLARKKDQLENARQHLARAATLGSKGDAFERETWLLQAQSGEVRDSMPHLSALLDVSWNETPEVYEAFALGIIRSRTNLEVAYQLLSQWSAEFPDSPRPHYLLARLSLELEDVQRAESSLRRALELDPQYAPAALTLGELLLEAKQPDEGLKYFRTAAGSDSHRETALIGQAKCLRELGMQKNAREILEHVLAANSDSTTAIIELARIDCDTGKFAQAIQRLQPVLERNPKNHEALWISALARRATGDEKQASEFFEVAAEIRNQLSRARQLTMQLLSDVKNINLRRTIGSIYLSAGDEEKGLAWLRSVLELQPSDRATLEALVDYYESKRDSRSQELAEQYRSRVPSAGGKKVEN